MPALSSFLLGAAVVAGVGSQVATASQERKAQKTQQRALAQKTLEAKNAAAVQDTRDDTGAKVKLGSKDAKKTTAKTKTAATSRTGTVGNSIGGLGASASLGL